MSVSEEIFNEYYDLRLLCSRIDGWLGLKDTYHIPYDLRNLQTAHYVRLQAVALRAMADDLERSFRAARGAADRAHEINCARQR